MLTSDANPKIFVRDDGVGAPVKSRTEPLMGVREYLTVTFACNCTH